jgi:hypothetical protein
MGAAKQAESPEEPAILHQRMQNQSYIPGNLHHFFYLRRLTQSLSSHAMVRHVAQRGCNRAFFRGIV